MQFCFGHRSFDYVSSKVNPFAPFLDATFRAFTPAVRETQRHPDPRFCEPGARAMPPLTGVGERFAPRATWSCIDEPLQRPGRSRSASLPTPVKGRAWRHRLLRAPGMSGRFSSLTEPQAPRMLDEPPALFLHTAE